MEATKRPQLCRWAEPTLFMPWPVWLEAWTCPWSCLVDGEPRPLVSTEVCRTCPRWEARPESASAPSSAARVRAQ